MLNKLTVKLKVLSLILMATIGTLFLLSIIYLNAMQGKASLNSFVNDAVTPINKLKQLEDNMRWTYQNIIEVSGEYSATVASHTIMEKKIKIINQALQNLDEEIFTRNNVQIEEITSHWNKYVKVIEVKMLPAYYEDDLELVSEIAQEEAFIHYFNIEKVFEILNKKLNLEYEKISTKSSSDIDEKLYMSVGLTLVLLVLFWFLGYFITNNLVLKPLMSFQAGLFEFFKYLNKENKEVKELPIIYQDEIGNMAQAVNVNIKNIKKLIDEDESVIQEVSKLVNEIAEGELSGRIQAHTNNPTVSRLSNELNNMMDALQSITSQIIDVLATFERKDFTKQSSLECKGDMEKVILSINSLGESISKMLFESSENGFQLQNNSTQLSNMFTQVSQSSNEQAAFLEETAASLEEMTANIINDKENFVRMSKFSQELNKSIQEGQNLAQETVNAMNDINTQTNAISDAIVIIDQIAFQTNILSLNAAVEAATAGEAGKGFAVVAQEVRNLAARSAEAAKEIKSIVEQATNKTDAGKVIADSMINGYVLLQENTEKTTEVIEIISNNAVEQQKGIEQINSAVNELDQMTQQNASSVSKTMDIASQTQEMADEMVSKANESIFIGKAS